MRTRTIGAALALLAGFALAAAAQQAQQQAPFVFHANVGEVLAHATVVNRKGEPVTMLPESDFTIYENGVPQRIQYFAHDDAPVSVGILLDNSGSMQGSRPAVDRAAINFVKASNPDDEVFVVNFSDEYYLDAPFTNSIPTLDAALEHIESSGGTALYDAIIASVDYMNNNARNDKHVLLVVTDGDDDDSRYTLEQTVRMLQVKNTPLIYCIGILDSLDTRSMKHAAERALKALSKASGGTAFFPKNLKQVNAITLTLAHEIRTQYTFAYRSNQTGAGYRAIRIDVKDRHQKHLTVHTRGGYYDPGTGSQPLK
ncbi:MAG: VWA domain-containing protein [Terriglobales bacterium]